MLVYFDVILYGYKHFPFIKMGLTLKIQKIIRIVTPLKTSVVICNFHKYSVYDIMFHQTSFVEHQFDFSCN